MKHLTLSIVLFTGILLQSNAQLTVADDNKVGVGVSAPVSKLAVNAAGSTYSTLFVENSTASANQRAAKFYKSANGGTWSYGLISHANVNGGSRVVGGLFASYNASPKSSYRAIGLYSYAGNATDGYNYGVWARLYGEHNGAALFATTGTNYEINTQGVYAGYFRGKVFIEDSLLYTTMGQKSDINLKKDIRLIANEETKQIDKIRNLSAIKYKLKNPGDLYQVDPKIPDTLKVDPRTIEYTSMLYTKDHIGFSAQEVQEIYPELVNRGSDGYLNMNYIGLIPILVEALKEQDEAMKELDIALEEYRNTLLEQGAEIEALRKEIEKLQNPPATEQTADL